MKQETEVLLISIIVPCHNEEENVALFYEALEKHLLRGYTYEVIFIDDGSRDGTAEAVNNLQPTRSDMTIRLIELARNFGKEITVTAGLHAAKGTAAVVIDADLQHPPQVIQKFLDEWHNGADVVVGVRDESKTYAPFYKRFGSKLFYKIINAISEVDIVPRATDFRLLDRIVIDEFNRFSERDRITRGLIDWLGFRRSFVYFVPAERVRGQAGYSFKKLTGLALNSFVAMSLVPLKLAGYIGALITVFFGIIGAFVAFMTYVVDDPFGWNISPSVDLAILLIFLVGIVLVALGLMARYIATIHKEVVNRPLYVVRRPRQIRPRPLIPEGSEA